MADMIAGILNSLFGPVMGLQPMLSLLAVSLTVTFAISVLYRFLTDPKKMKELKDRAKEISARTKEIQKTNPDEAKKLTDEMLSLTNKQMMSTMKPMMGTLLIAALVLPWMAVTFTGPIVNLPASVPYFGADLGWLMWYILISIPSSQVMRKLLGVDL